jgi:hypothetical protein
MTVYTAWSGPAFCVAYSDLPTADEDDRGFVLRQREYGENAPDPIEQEFDDLDQFLDAMRCLSERWWTYGHVICFSRRDVELYLVLKQGLLIGDPEVSDHTGLLAAGHALMQTSFLEDA